MAIARPELPSTASKAGGLVPRALKCSRRSRPPQPRLRYRVIADSRKWLILHSLNAERTYSLAYIRERNLFFYCNRPLRELSGLEEDFRPVFGPALAALDSLTVDEAKESMRWIMESTVAVADELASLRFDHAGPLYHRLLASAKYDGSYYTNHVSAVLLARLALTEESADWSDTNRLTELRIIDPACGTGTLLMAAMHAIRDRHEKAKATADESDLLHLALVEDVLHGLDVNRHGVHLAACNLTLGNPRVDYRRMNLFTMKHGPQAGGRTSAGSLEFLATAREDWHITSLAAPLPTMAELEAERAQPGSTGQESLTGRFDVVIMNPPFTRNDIRNRQYSKKDRKAVQEREKTIALFLKDRDEAAYNAIRQTSIESFFPPLADVLLKPKGATLASVVPTTALTGASSRPKRVFIAKRFQLETVITSHDPERINFSENTNIHESLMIARRAGDKRQPTRFISLARMPRDTHEAILLSDIINNREPLGEWGTEHSWPWPLVREGDWRAAQFYDVTLAQALHDLEALAGTLLRPVADLCHIGPEGRRIRDAFIKKRKPNSPWTTPILWNHRTEFQMTMNAQPDVLGAPAAGRDRLRRNSQGEGEPPTDRQPAADQHGPRLCVLRRRASTGFGMGAGASH